MQHAVVTRDEWLNARREMLKAEKELTRLGDKVTRERLALPWVRIGKEYVFDTLEGRVGWLTSLTAGRNFWSSTSCSRRGGRKRARAARSWPITSMA